jgi:hypothetical protein
MLAKLAVCALLAAATISTAGAGQTAAVDIHAVPVPAAKRDNGLGTLRHYREWREAWVYAMPADRIDSGLGDLPPFSAWREPWVYAIPAESIDDGLGELPPLVEWPERWFRAMSAESALSRAAGS